jgi:hypothetical protein
MKKALFSPRPITAKSVLERRRRQVISLVESLPEASAVVAGETHLSLEVRGKRFDCFLDDHHGDGRVALNCKTAPGVNETRVASERFFIMLFNASHGLSPSR